jgi:hypothetical protein
MAALDSGNAINDLFGWRLQPLHQLIGGAAAAAQPYRQQSASDYEKVRTIVNDNVEYIFKQMKPAKIEPGKNGEIFVYNHTASKPEIPDLFIKVQTNKQSDVLSHEYAILRTLNAHHDELPVFPQAYYYKDLPSGDSIMITEFVLGNIAHDELHKSYSDDKLGIIIQLLYSLYYAGERWKFAHNDLHGGNTIVTKLKKPVILRMVIDGDTAITIKTRYLIHIIDLGRSGVEKIPVPKEVQSLIKTAKTAMHTRIELIIRDEVSKILRRYTKGTDFLSVMQSILSILNTIERHPSPKTRRTQALFSKLKNFVKIQVYTGRTDKHGRKIIRGTNVNMKAIMQFVAEVPEVNNLKSATPDATWGR